MKTPSVVHSIPVPALEIKQTVLVNGQSRSSYTAKSYWSMRQRCSNPRHDAYPRYGGRGITVCNRWLGRGGFSRFAQDMGLRPPGHQLDRKNNSKGYSKSNCRWVTRKANARNRRDNVTCTVDGVTRCLAEWAEVSRLNRYTIKTRLLMGWKPKMAVSAENHDRRQQSKPMKWSADLVARLVELRRVGVSMAKISALLDCNYVQLKNKCQEMRRAGAWTPRRGGKEAMCPE